MNERIEVRRESRRGCGYRKVGGLYLVSGQLAAGCGKLPMETVTCPACGCGIKPARGWTWIKPKGLFPPGRCPSDPLCAICPAGHAMPERAGLIWIGAKFYPTTESFVREANRMGVSRRITAVPRGFKLGEDFVFLAHREAVPVAVPTLTREGLCAACKGPPISLQKVVWKDGSQRYQCLHCNAVLAPYGVGLEDRVPGVFVIFKPTAIEKVVDPEEVTEEELDALEKRGITPVHIERVDGGDNGELEV